MNDPVLQFAMNVLRSNHIQACVLPDSKWVDAVPFDLGLRKGILGIEEDILARLNELSPNTVYHITDAFGCLYSLLHLSSGDTLFIGPTMETEDWKSLCDQISTERKLPPAIQEQLKDYYNRLPKLSLISGYHSIVLELGKHLFGERLAVEYVQAEYTKPYDSASTAPALAIIEKPILSMQMMEERIELENRLLEAIHHGNEALALQVLQNFGGITVPYRDEQNIALSIQYRLVGLNASFRKEVEQVDVHPLFVDQLSNRILFRIAEVTTPEESQKMVISMIHSYCDLVKRYSIANYSPVIKNVIRYARTHLNEDLSLRTLAERNRINRTYLSSLFRQETGTTLTEYINRMRVEYAVELLSGSKLSITAVSAELGFTDVSYFIRVFKNVMGQTPAQYVKNQ